MADHENQSNVLNPTEEIDAVDKVQNLEGEVNSIKNQLAEVIQFLKESQPTVQETPADNTVQVEQAASEPAPADTPVQVVQAAPQQVSIAPQQVADEAPRRHQVYVPEAYRVGILQFSLPTPTTRSISKVLETRLAYGDTGKLNQFGKPKHIVPFPAKRFIPEPAGLFGRIKESDTRDCHEAEVLWNIGHDAEVATAAFHQVAEALTEKNWTALTEALSVAYHFHKSAYERVQERVDFFADSLESGKSEAILLQKYLREDDRSYSSALYRDARKHLGSLRDKAFAKELVSSQASQSKPAQNKKRGANAKPQNQSDS